MLVETKEYRAWANMKARCHNPQATGYERYGGRGLKVCIRWRNSFDAFLADVGPAPSPGHVLSRIDTDAGYRPGNVVWREVLVPVSEEVSHRRRRRSRVADTRAARSAGKSRTRKYLRRKQSAKGESHSHAEETIAGRAHPPS